MFKVMLPYFIVLCFYLALVPATHAESVKNTHKTFNLAKQAIKKTKMAETSSQIMALHSLALRQLMLRLYRDNPQALKKSTQVSAEEMVQWTFEGPFSWKFEGVRRLQGLEALGLAIDADFPGDRVLALITGLHTMLIKAYGGKTESDFTDEVNPQTLYNAARNIEIASLKLNLLNQARQDDLQQMLVLLADDKPTDLTHLLREIINRVDMDANHLAEQTQKIIQPLNLSLTDSITWQSQ